MGRKTKVCWRRHIKKNKRKKITIPVTNNIFVNWCFIKICVRKSKRNWKLKFKGKKNNSENKYAKNESRSCFSCGKNSHIARECTLKKKTIKCFKCKKEGHYIIECPEKNTNNNVQFKRDLLIDERKIIINGKILDAVFDTGASMNMIYSGAINYIKKFGHKTCKKKIFLFWWWSKWNERIIYIEFEYDGRKYFKEFNVVGGIT